MVIFPVPSLMAREIPILRSVLRVTTDLTCPVSPFAHSAADSSPPVPGQLILYALSPSRLWNEINDQPASKCPILTGQAFREG